MGPAISDYKRSRVRVIRTGLVIAPTYTERRVHSEQLHTTPPYWNTMAPERDMERGRATDERAPLLGNESARERTRTPSSRSEAAEEPQKEVSKTWHYVWRGTLALLVILLIAVFVKGWIDADDVDVRTHLTNPHPNPTAHPVPIVRSQRRTETCFRRRS